jgi:Domain of unknown function (DUF932)
MPPKVPLYTEQQLRNAPLPNHGGRYAVVPHGDIIDEVKKEITNNGFTILREEYKMTVDGQVAQGIYHLNYNTGDMGMMFAWSNSYNKTMRFKCGVGAYVFVCANGVLRGDIGNYSRKHSGVAYQQVMNEIKEQLANAQSHYDNLVQDRNMLDKVMLSPRDKGRILGELFAEDEILTLTQVGIVKREIDKPSHNYNSHVDSAWTMYNHVTLALKESHPTSYMKDHQKLHDWFINKYGASAITIPVENEVFASEYDQEEVIGVNFL